jgi:GNAT superfamily N-acetyltransferase
VATTRISCKYVAQLTSEEYKQCRRLTLGAEGMLQKALQDVYAYEHKHVPRGYCRKRPPAQVLLVRERETLRLVAWCLVDGYGFAQMYVRARYRRQGLGTKLLRKLMQLRPDARVCPHDHISRAFFRAQKPELAPRIARGYTLQDSHWR